eukprot:CAMPEP_0178409218 /NCGR_PEP_ID=MMETSP0689_2-20121128/20350_1 /TAXON_ID=160604 /ORGANISM="Amphidinium massartii, Strain CS-259" /LENGTH=93 /DNA_ID=CAMNT_0020030355 /DNA_START=1051 /DNA_END=1332 /DNA_ORIENTATION=+
MGRLILCHTSVDPRRGSVCRHGAPDPNEDPAPRVLMVERPQALRSMPVSLGEHPARSDRHCHVGQLQRIAHAHPAADAPSQVGPSQLSFECSN